MENPLKEADPNSLTELFARDPLDLADKDIDVIVAEFRRQRALWVQAEAQGKKPTAKKAPAAKTDKKAVSLEDLGL